MDEVERLQPEYGAQRCTATCPPRLIGGTCHHAHWCLLASGHEGEHVWRCRVEATKAALEESVKLQSHYARLLNQYDGGTRLTFGSAAEWMERLEECKGR